MSNLIYNITDINRFHNQVKLTKTDVVCLIFMQIIVGVRIILNEFMLWHYRCQKSCCHSVG